MPAKVKRRRKAVHKPTAATDTRDAAHASVRHLMKHGEASAVEEILDLNAEHGHLPETLEAIEATK
jgi:hypothetical protein